MKCKNCGQPITQGWQGEVLWYHLRGEGSVIMRCDPKLSGGAYGLNAEPDA